MRRASSIAAIVLAGLALVGCTSDDGVAGDYGAGSGDSGYISGAGTVQEYAPGERSEPVEFAGATVDGSQFDSSSVEGPMVVNFWYASCPPCRVEAPILAGLDAEYGDRVTFVGVNTRDAAAQADQFDQAFGIEYPSILDADTGGAQLAFAGQVAPNATPTTIILDAEGRVAARVTGSVSDDSIISTLLDDELAR